MNAPEPIQAEIRNKIAEIAETIKQVRAENKATTYTSLHNYGVQVNVLKNILTGKRYTVESLLLILHECDYTITITKNQKQ